MTKRTASEPFWNEGDRDTTRYLPGFWNRCSVPRYATEQRGSAFFASRVSLLRITHRCCKRQMHRFFPDLYPLGNWACKLDVSLFSTSRPFIVHDIRVHACRVSAIPRVSTWLNHVFFFLQLERNFVQGEGGGSYMMMLKHETSETVRFLIEKHFHGRVT